MSDRVVARLVYPLPINKGLSWVIKGLELTYGKGLVIVSQGEDWREGWLTICKPRPLDQEVQP